MQTGQQDQDESPQTTKSKLRRSEVKGMNSGRTFRTFIFFFFTNFLFYTVEGRFCKGVFFFSEVVVVGAMI